ncbi:MAG: hypothetical protein M0R33_04480 [Methylomonas sp.]|jgi:hypothetical protein|uniref:hypothetical protein n=1 Tax=Methylomonas sp. TaxID=418 RepID=UPI0025E4112C|nr:hypothetical protein [Methylomonas sp.]MCK9605691.1 hypothetical protein [Methylomonas sp.]
MKTSLTQDSQLDFVNAEGFPGHFVLDKKSQPSVRDAGFLVMQLVMRASMALRLTL